MNIGVFYFIGNKIISHHISLQNGEKYGENITFSAHWDLWQRFVKDYPEYDFLDYDYFPRGRVVYNLNKEQYILYIDHKIRSQEYIDKIKSVFGFNDNFVFGEDEHYQSQQPVEDIDPDELDGDHIY